MLDNASDQERSPTGNDVDQGRSAIHNVSGQDRPRVEGSSGGAGCGTYAIFALVSLTILATVGISQLFGWFAAQLALIEDTPFTWYTWPAITAGAVAIMAIVVLPATTWTPSVRYRAVYRCWSVALGCAVVFGLARAFQHNSTQLAGATQTAIALVLWVIIRGRSAPSSGPAYGRWIALGLVPVAALPWFTMGALGSLFDVVLAILQGLSFGLLVSVIVQRLLIGPLLTTTHGSGWDIALGGFAAGLAIAILLCGFGFNGNQLLMLLALTPLGYAAVALGWQAVSRGRTAHGAIAWLIGGATAAALALIDPAELLLILGTVELPAYALAAAGLASVVAWALGALLWAVRDRDLDHANSSVRWGSVGILWLLGAMVYVFVGAPGLYGDRLFVVMSEQVDTATVTPTGGREERLAATYRLLADHADRTQADLRAQFDRWGIGYTPYYLVNGIEVDGGPFVRAYLERHPAVDRVLLSPRLRPLPEPLPVEGGDTEVTSSPGWNIATIGAERVWNEFRVTGEGIVVGQSDSGVQGNHPALREGYRGRDGENDGNWLDPWNGTTTPSDVGGHGTHTLGSAVGRNGIGVAPGAQWFGCVNLGRNIGNPARYLDCLQFMLAPHAAGADPLHAGDPGRAAHVINNSWGCPELEGCDPLVLAPAVRALRTAGIFVVASAGNSGPRCASVSDPIAIYDESFTVGATDERGDITSFSSRGPVGVDGSNRQKPDILAPGDEVVSSLPQSSYGPNSGTSMAGPHVVGVVALMWSAQPRLIGDIDATERILRETAQPYEGAPVTCVDANGAEQTTTESYGIVDAYGAVQAALSQ